MFKDLVTANRSYRGYDETRVITRDELIDLVDHARLVPSSVNAQPFRYYLAHEKQEVAKIQAETKWARALPDLQLPHDGMCPTAFIVICQDTNLGNSIPRFQKDVGIVAQTILLAAAEKELGGCMIGNYSGASVRACLDLPAHLVPVLIIALGKPAEEVVMTELTEGESTAYYRDQNDTHYVPKRKLVDIIL